MTYYFLLILKYAAYLSISMATIFLLLRALKCRKLLKLSQLTEAVKETPGSGFPAFYKAVAWLLLSLVAAMILANAQSGLHGQATISLNYQNASKGLNPDGSRYNMSEILSDDVLERAIEAGAFENVTVDALKKSLTLVPSVQGTVDNESHYRISTEFVLSYNATEATSELNASTVLQAVMQAYQDWYYEKYVDRFSLLSTGFDEADSFDYLEMCDYLDKKAQNLSFYLKAYEQKDAAFRQEGNENTFSTLLTSCWQFRDVALENLRAYIMENGLSKNRESYLGKLVYESRLAQFDYSKAFQSHAIRLEAIEMYENDMAQTVLVPSYDTSGEFYMSRTRIGIDGFSREAQGFAGEMSELDYLIAKNDMIAQKLAGSTAGSEKYAQAEQMIEDLKAQLVRLSGSAKQLVSASQEKDLNQGFTLMLQTNAANYWIYAAKVFALGVFFLAVLAATKVLNRLCRRANGDRKEGAGS